MHFYPKITGVSSALGYQVLCALVCYSLVPWAITAITLTQANGILYQNSSQTLNCACNENRFDGWGTKHFEFAFWRGQKGTKGGLRSSELTSNEKPVPGKPKLREICTGLRSVLLHPHSIGSTSTVFMAAEKSPLLTSFTLVLRGAPWL